MPAIECKKLKELYPGFSKRMEWEKEFRGWAEKHGVEVCPTSIIGWTASKIQSLERESVANDIKSMRYGFALPVGRYDIEGYIKWKHNLTEEDLVTTPTIVEDLPETTLSDEIRSSGIHYEEDECEDYFYLKTKSIKESIRKLNEKLSLYEMKMKYNPNEKEIILREHEKRAIVKEIFGGTLV